MNAAEIRAKSDDELKQELMSLRKESFNLRMQQATGQLSRPSEMREVRRSIARLKTIIGERSRGGEQA